MNEIDIDKVKQVIDTLVRSRVIDSIMQTMDHGFGEVHFKISIQKGAIHTIFLTDTRTVRIDKME